MKLFERIIFNPKINRPKDIPLILWLKKYFDNGMGLTSYFRWVIYGFGLASQNAKATIIMAIVWALSSLVIGWAWMEKGWSEKEAEIGNVLNRFQREMRQKMKKLK